MALLKAVQCGDDKGLRQLLNDSNEDLNETSPCLLHFLVSSADDLQGNSARNICHMLCNAGLSVNNQNQDGDTALHCLLQMPASQGLAQLCVALLQSGADANLPNYHGLTVMDILQSSKTIPDLIREVFKKYSPGLWQAVLCDDLLAVRRLINLWCRVDITKNSKTLKELALEKGMEHIIRLITDINLPMKLAHSVLASDLRAVKEICQSEKPLNTEFRNLGDMGATPLFYAIMQNSVSLVSLLISKGAKATTTIAFDEEDIPIYFTALNRETDFEIIRQLTASIKDSIPLLLYRGNHILLHCIHNQVHPAAVLNILQGGYSELVALRNQKGLCARDVAEEHGMQIYVDVIDSVMYDWYLETNGEHRKTLALLGYPHMRTAAKDGVRVCEVVSSMETSSEQAKFDTQLSLYQDQIEQLHRAVECGHLEQTQSLMYYNGPHKNCFHRCLIKSLPQGETQPLLIKAVLRGSLDLVQYLCRTLLHQTQTKVDDCRDAFIRTPLHYAYANCRRKDIVSALLDFGTSEFTMDKNERSPLVFRELSHLKEMTDLLEYHIEADFSRDEPSPFTVKRSKVPLTCGHTPEEHLRHRQSTKSTQKQIATVGVVGSWWNALSSCVIL